MAYFQGLSFNECISMMTERRAVKLPQVRSELEFASHICERAKEDPQNQAVPCPCLNELFFWMWLMAEDTTEAVDTRRNQRHKIPLRRWTKMLDFGLASAAWFWEESCRVMPHDWRKCISEEFTKNEIVSTGFLYHLQGLKMMVFSTCGSVDV